MFLVICSFQWHLLYLALFHFLLRCTMAFFCCYIWYIHILRSFSSMLHQEKAFAVAMWRVSMIWLWDLSCLKQYKDSHVWGLRPEGGSAFNETDFLAKTDGEKYWTQVCKYWRECSISACLTWALLTLLLIINIYESNSFIFSACANEPH